MFIDQPLSRYLLQEECYCNESGYLQMTGPFVPASILTWDNRYCTSSSPSIKSNSKSDLGIFNFYMLVLERVPAQWTWIWVNSGSWWWTGRPGMLWFMGSQRVGQDWTTELNWSCWSENCICLATVVTQRYTYNLI